jgi:hypothetical protein
MAQPAYQHQTAEAEAAEAAGQAAGMAQPAFQHQTAEAEAAEAAGQAAGMAQPAYQHQAAEAEAAAPAHAYAPQSSPGNEKKAKWAFVSIGVGAVGLVGALTGLFTMGWIIIVIGIIFGVNALKTSKRGFAILGIVLNCISIPIFILAVVYAFAGL